MAIYIVNSLNDGPVNHADDATNLTLRDAIALAEANAGADEIVFASNLAGTLTLSSGELLIVSGNEVSINGDTTGDGNPDIVLDGNNNNAHFQINTGGNLSLQSLALNNGNVVQGINQGGSITNQGTLSIAYCDFSNNESSGYSASYDGYNAAGAIFNHGNLNITQSTLTGGLAEGANGANNPFGDNGYNGGSAASGIVNLGALTISHTVIEGGTATGGNGGTGAQGASNYNGYDGGDGGHAAHGILNFGTITAGSSVQNRNPGVIMGGGGGLGGDPGYGGSGPGNEGSPGIAYGANGGNLTNLGTETYNGTSGADTVSLGPNDSFFGLNGNDVISADRGSTLDGGAGNDILTSHYNSNVFGGIGNDTIINTYITGGTWDGGAGIDTLNVNTDEFFNLVLDLNAPSFAILGATFSGFENITTAGGYETIIDQNNVVNIINAGGGDDTVQMYVTSIGDEFDGGSGTNTLVQVGGVFGAVNVINLSTGYETYGSTKYAKISNFQNVSVSGQIGIIGDGQNNILKGISTDSGFSNNIFDGGAGQDELDGGLGDDSLKGGADGDILKGGSNNAGGDTIVYEGSNAGVVINLHLGTASGGHATGDTFSGIENVTGSAHNDTLSGDANANVLDGGLGTNDTLSYANSNVAVSVNLATGTVSGGHATGDTIAGFERVIGSNFADTLRGSSSVDRLIGGDGDDRIFGSLGADSLNGGTGSDTLDYTSSNVGVSINLSNNFASGGFAEADAIANFENVNGSNLGADLLVGNAAANILRGNGGNDTLEGGAGGDTLIGGQGTNDTVSYSGSGTGVTVNIATNAVSGGDAALDVISGFESVTGSAFDDNLTGNSLTNVLLGNAGDDLMFGGSGADTLEGDFGNDVLDGGIGADILNGGDDIDTATYERSTLAVRVDLLAGTASGGEAAGDTFFSIENLRGSNFADRLTLTNVAGRADGLDGNDVLTGGTEADRLYGGKDNDVLTGKAGTDQLSGGLNFDRFVFSMGDSGQTVATADKILDYAKGAVGTGDELDFNVALRIGGSAAAATATQASINATTAVATFAAGSGVSMADALNDITARFTAATDTAGEFALFQLAGAGAHFLFVSDGTAGVTANDVLIRLDNITTIGSINLTAGDLTILT